MSYAFFIVSHYSLTTLLTFYKQTIYQNKEETYKEVPDGRIMYRLRYSCSQCVQHYSIIKLSFIEIYNIFVHDFS